MDGTFTFALVLVALAAIIGLVTLFLPRGGMGYDEVPVRKITTVMAAALAGFAVLLTVLSSFTIVSPRKVAIPTEFGKPGTGMANGFHWVAPWAEITELDGAVQTDTYDDKGAIKARLAQQSIGYVDVTVKWKITDGGAQQLFNDYREFSKIKNSLVTRELGAAVNAALADYDPLTTELDSQPTQEEMAAEIKRILQTKVSSKIDIMSVIVPLVRFDEKTQARIDKLQAAVADTNIAEQRKKTATADAEANKTLAGSVSNNPNVLVSRCLDLLGEVNVPTGFQCWPGTGGTLVAPTTK